MDRTTTVRTTAKTKANAGILRGIQNDKLFMDKHWGFEREMC
jgi:hypothetical protein